MIFIYNVTTIKIGFIVDFFIYKNIIKKASQKFYIVHKTSKNFVCIECLKKKIVLYLKFTVTREEDLEMAREVIKVAFENIGE